MSSQPIALPALHPSPAGPLRITATDVSQFVRLEQCERFLRLRLSERSGSRFLEDYGVAHQRISPLLSRSGKSSEETIEADLDARFRTVHYAAKYGADHNRPANNAELLAQLRGLGPGQTVILFQTRMHARLGGWVLRGDVDLLRAERLTSGVLRILIADMKSTTEVKVEHRLQVAFYRLMLETLLAENGLAAEWQTGILFRPPADPTTEEAVENIPTLRDAACEWFGFGPEGPLLEVIAIRHDRVATKNRRGKGNRVTPSSGG